MDEPKSAADLQRAIDAAGAAAPERTRRPSPGPLGDGPVVLRDRPRTIAELLSDAADAGASRARVVWALAAVIDALVRDIDGARMLEHEGPEVTARVLRRWCLNEATRTDVVGASVEMTMLALLTAAPDDRGMRIGAAYFAVTMLAQACGGLADGEPVVGRPVEDALRYASDALGEGDEQGLGAGWSRGGMRGREVGWARAQAVVLGALAEPMVDRRDNRGAPRRPTVGGRSDGPVELDDRAWRWGDMLGEAWRRGASKARLVWAMAAVADAIAADLDARRLLGSDEPEAAVGAMRRWCLREAPRADVAAARDRSEALAAWAAGPGGPWGRVSTGYSAIASIVGEAVALIDGRWSDLRSWSSLYSAADALRGPGEPREVGEALVASILLASLMGPMLGSRPNDGRSRRAKVVVSTQRDDLIDWVTHLTVTADGVPGAQADGAVGTARTIREHVMDSSPGLARQIGRGGGLYGFVFEVVVPPGEQSRGVGRALMKGLTDGLFGLGAEAVFLEADPFGHGLPLDRLIAFYESIGFSVDPRSGEHVMMRLDRPEGRDNPPKNATRFALERRDVAPGVAEFVARAKAGHKVLGAAVVQVGELDALLQWKQRAGVGGWASAEWDAFDPGDVVGYLQSVSVSRSLRGRGVGRRLMEMALAAADEYGARSVWLSVAPLDAETEAEQLVAFYESLGFRRMEGHEESWSPSMVRVGHRADS